MVLGNILIPVFILQTLASSWCGAFTAPANGGTTGRRPQRLNPLDGLADGATGEDDDNAPHFFLDEECYDLCETEDIPIPPAPTKTATPRSPSKVISNLELRFSIDDSGEDCDVEDVSSCSDACDVCVGRGVIDCRFCGGSGWMDFGEQTPGTMGERLVRENGGVRGTECPVCNEDSVQVCRKCMGSGWIARWRMGNLSELQP